MIEYIWWNRGGYLYLMKKEQLEIDIHGMYERLDSIEELLKILIANNLLDEVELTLQDKEHKKILNEDISAQLSLKGIIENEHYKALNKVIVELICERKITIRDIMEVREWMIKEMEGTIPLFCFDKLNGMQRKRMLEEKISFKVKNKELHIVEV